SPSSMTISQLLGKRIGIFGAGAEGRSLWEALRRWGGPLPRVLSDRPVPPGTVPPEIFCSSGEEIFQGLGQIDLLVRSPGIPLTHPLLPEAARREVEVTTTTNLFLGELRSAGLPVIGITGSKGKSTTSTLTYETLREAGRPAVLAGNIGT